MLLWGCGEAPGSAHARLLLGWRMADGRSCADSGVETVVVGTAPALAGHPRSFSCLSGQGTSRVTLTAPSGVLLVRVEGRSAAGSVLYAGQRRVDLPAWGEVRATLVLVFVGGGP